MLLKITLLTILLLVGIFIAFRFGVFRQEESSEPITEIKQEPTPTVLPPTIKSKSEEISTTSATIKLLEAPKEATPGQTLLFKWFIDNPKIATISHTAVHYGTVSKPNPKLPSDYPEKSIILKGTIPATFSTQLKIPLIGLYYYRAHAIIDKLHIWSEEKAISVTTPSAMPTSTQ